MTNAYKDVEDENPAQLQMLMAFLASVNDQMINLAIELRTKPAVKTATRGCDVRKYRDAFRFDDKALYAFEAYLETETHSGYLVCWLVDINCALSGWELNLAITRRRKSEDNDETTTFSEVRAASFAEFVSLVSGTMNAFVESARSYDFP